MKSGRCDDAARQLGRHISAGAFVWDWAILETRLLPSWRPNGASRAHLEIKAWHSRNENLAIPTRDWELTEVQWLNGHTEEASVR
jgi:hypothetical protein